MFPPPERTTKKDDVPAASAANKYPSGEGSNQSTKTSTS
jgi:hypothetical protein